MLTVDYDLLRLKPGDKLLDLGCGFGRHGFEGLRRGADVFAFDYSPTELQACIATFGAMHEAGEAPPNVAGTATNGDACKLPFDDNVFDRIIASEVLEHIPNDVGAIEELTRVLRPGGTMAITVPAEFAEKICWSLSDEYHAPFVEGGHVRIYSEQELREKLRAAGMEPRGAHHVHGIHAPYWWLKCAVGPTNDEHPLVQAYHRLLVWDIEKGPLATKLLDIALRPIGKSFVLYSRKPEEGS